MGEKIEKVIIPSLDDPFKGGGVGGKHTHIRLLAAGLVELGVRSDIVYPKEGLGFRLLRKYPGAIKRRLMSDKESRVDSWTQQKIARMKINVRNSALDGQILNPQDTLSMSILDEELRRRGPDVPSVLTVHGYYARELVSAEDLNMTSPRMEALLRDEIKAYGLANRIICVDTRIRDYIHQNAGVGKEHMAIIPNAVNTIEFQPANEARIMVLRESLGFPKASKILLCPRRLVPKNGVEFAIKAMRTISRTYNDALLLIAGDGPQRAYLQGLVKENGLENNVKFLGGVAHKSMPSYYQCSNIVVIPSVPSQGVEEATSLSMLEGMACAKPVIVTNIGGLKETVVDGYNGHMVEAGDGESIANATIHILEERERSEVIAMNALAFVRRDHSHTVHARKVLQQYQLALDMTT